jgi:hypothetical protein
MLLVSICPDCGIIKKLNPNDEFEVFSAAAAGALYSIPKNKYKKLIRGVENGKSNQC